ncbi:hypothetical protein ACPWSR_16965 [Alloiococcus sp. CFN-8]|uniref:hypothetical protein n=1 Tax=Alloiococcus sp. CFN-8 TaxID=3416081 RepID=UPI003CEBBFD0
MGRHKQMPGRTYKIVSQNSSEAIVDCTYLCPYCDQETTVQITVNSDGFDLIERGGFYEPLTCEYCNKTTDVRFFKGNKI